MNKIMTKSIIKFLLVFVAAILVPTSVAAQFDDNNQFDQFGQQSTDNNGRLLSGKMSADSLGTDKEIPRGIRVWTVDSRFGDQRPAVVDTISHMYPNTIFTTGMRGEYNTTGNLGAPRINRIFIDRASADQFIFTQPYDYVVSPSTNSTLPIRFHLSPTCRITMLATAQTAKTTSRQSLELMPENVLV